MLIQTAINNFKRAKQYYITTVLTLALTLSMVLSVFSLVDLVFFAPLPYNESNNLYLLEGRVKAEGFDGAASNAQIISHIDEQNDLFVDLATYHTWSDYKLYDKIKRPEVDVILTSSNLFTVLGVEPELGRLFNKNEALGTKQTSVILGYRTWQKHYGADKDIIGKKIQLNQRRFNVIGVTPDNLVLPHYNDINDAVWIPMDMDETFKPKTSPGFMESYKAVVRLKPAIKAENITEQLNQLAIAGAEIYTPEVLKDFTVGAKVTDFKTALQGDSGKIVLMLLVGSVLLMVIALINLSSMQIARAISKVKNLAISFAFGASSKKLAISAFKHNIATIGLAVVLALLLTQSSFSLMELLAANSIQRLDTLSISTNTLLLSIALALTISAFYTYIELSVVKEKNLTDSLQSSGKGIGKQVGAGVSHTLIGLQVMFSFIVLLAASHVVLMTLSEALRSNGLNTDNKWSLIVNYSNLDIIDERINLHKTLLEQISQLDSVTHVLPVSEPRLPENLNVNQIYREDGGYIAQVRQTRIGLGYLEALELSVFGRGFKAGDSELANFPVIINQRLADLIDQNSANIIGQKISFNNKTFHPIIGVAANTYVPGSIEDEAYEVFNPLKNGGWREYSYLITTAQSQDLEMQLRDVTTRVNPRLDIAKLITLERQFDQKRQLHIAAAGVAIVLASLSLLMVCIGINGIVNYMVQVRRYSLGVKLAMGACNQRLLKDSLAELMQPVIMSLVFSFSLSYLLTAYFNSQTLFKIMPNWTMTTSVWFGILLLSFGVSFFPVRHILRKDPIKALRDE
ncbi:ABC transporter permease [Shewanella japonica]|uniref:ABC transporter permease n=1 Tax=Shewanella japonica TaxID=93973 RepID=UPI002494E4ED|nr:ABC transporter permease [Shewanella japonica]